MRARRSVPAPEGLGFPGDGEADESMVVGAPGWSILVGPAAAVCIEASTAWGSVPVVAEVAPVSVRGPDPEASSLTLLVGPWSFRFLGSTET